jgi:endonuclease/exonuclease/phosphatase (EEP) superfamily protein YafD
MKFDRRMNLWSLLRLVTVALCAATVAGLGARTGWLFDMATGFRLQYLILLAVLFLLFLVGRKGGMMLLSAAFALANLWPVAGFYLPAQHAATSGSSVDVLFATVGVERGSGDSIAHIVRAARPALVALCGLDGEGIRRMRSLLAEYRYLVAQPRSDPFGVAIFSRLPLTHGRIETVGRSKSPVALARCRLPGGEITFVAARALPARGAATWNERNSQLADLGTLAAGEKGEVVLLGALEIAPWSPFFDDLLARGRLEDGRKGKGVKPTWPVWMSSAGVPLDHLLHTSGIVVGEIRTPRVAGENHRALVVSLRMTGR